MAVRWMRPIDKSDTLLHYLDQGSQHTSEKCQRLMGSGPRFPLHSRNERIWNDRLCRKAAVHAQRHLVVCKLASKIDPSIAW
jgi:hypothetical protein